MSRAVFVTADEHSESGGGKALTLEDLPDLLTVAEAAAYLRVGRNTAYALCRQWRLSGGREGLGCLSVGRGIRVPKVAVQRFVAAGHGSAPSDPRARLEPASAFLPSTSPANGNAPDARR